MSYKRRQHADGDFLVVLLAQNFQRLHHLRQAVQAEIAGLDRNDHFIAGAKRVKGNQPDARRAIDDAPLISFAHAVQSAGQAVFAARPSGKDLFERCQLEVRRGQVEVAGDLPDHFADAGGFAVAGFDQSVVDGSFDLFFGNGQSDAAMALGVHIDQKRSMAEPSQAGGQIDAGGGFPAPALLIDDGDGPH